MTPTRAQWAAGLGIAQRDLLLFASYRGRFLARVLTIFLTLSLFYYVSRLVHVAQFADPDRYFGFVVVGLAVLEVLTATLASTPLAVRSELLTGTFERLVVSPFGPVASIVAMTIFPTLLALTLAVLTLALGAVVFGLPLHWSTVPLAAPVAVLGALAFVPLTLLLCAAVLVAKQAGAGAAFVVSGLSLASGAFFPVGLLPAWLRWFSEVQPLTPALTLLRHLLVGTPLEGGAAVAVAKLVGFAVLLLPLGLVALRASVRTCRRRGTLMEY